MSFHNRGAASNKDSLRCAVCPITNTESKNTPHRTPNIKRDTEPGSKCIFFRSCFDGLVHARLKEGRRKFICQLSRASINLAQQHMQLVKGEKNVIWQSPGARLQLPWTQKYFCWDFCFCSVVFLCLFFIVSKVWRTGAPAHPSISTAHLRHSVHIDSPAPAQIHQFRLPIAQVSQWFTLNLKNLEPHEKVPSKKLSGSYQA